MKERAEICASIIAHYPQIAVVPLTSYIEDEIIDAALDAGARGYVCKDVDTEELKRALRAALSGQQVPDERVHTRVKARAG